MSAFGRLPKVTIQAPRVPMPSGLELPDPSHCSWSSSLRSKGRYRSGTVIQGRRLEDKSSASADAQIGDLARRLTPCKDDVFRPRIALEPISLSFNGSKQLLRVLHQATIAHIQMPPCAAMNMATADRQYDSISLSSAALTGSKRATIRRSDPLKSAANKRADRRGSGTFRSAFACN